MRIPKSLRRIGDKALADPKVAEIVSGALASVAALTAGREIAQDAAGGPSAAKALGRSEVVRGLSDVVRCTFEEVMEARHRNGQAPAKAPKAKQRRRDAEAATTPSDRDEDARAEGTDRLH